MNQKELKKRYDKLVAEIESAQMYDGRDKGVDVYVCEKCNKRFYTRYKDKGCTPFVVRCHNCNNFAMHNETIPEQVANVMGFDIHNWVRPTFEQLLKLNKCAQEHVLDGGLILENELET